MNFYLVSFYIKNQIFISSRLLQQFLATKFNLNQTKLLQVQNLSHKITRDLSTCGLYLLLFFRLYAVGGRDGSSCLRSVECFDPHTNKWSLCAPMTKRRGGVGVSTCNGFLYAVGGHDAPASNPTSSRFDCVERLETFF